MPCFCKQNKKYLVERKLTEDEEMALYAKKYERKSNTSSMNNKLRLLKSKNKLHHKSMCYASNELDDTEHKIVELKNKLKNPKLTSLQKYALKKKLKMEESKIIRAKRKAISEKKKFDEAVE